MNYNTKTGLNEKCRHYLQFSMILLFFGLFIIHTQAQSPTQIKISGGATYGYAPTLTFDTYEGSGNLVSIFGDLVINNKIIGRLQYSGLQVSSLSSGLASKVDSGYGLLGSFGYNFSTDNTTKLQIPVMLSSGYTQVFRSDNFTEQGMQIGLTISPEYEIISGLSAMISIRYLKGTEVAGGSAIDITDFGMGIKYTFIKL